MLCRMSTVFQWIIIVTIVTVETNGHFLFLKKHKDKHKADEHKPHPPAPHPPPPPPPPPPTTASTTSTTSTASTTKSAPIFLKPPCPKNVEYAPPDGNCTFSTGHKLYSKDDFIYQLNSPYRSIGPIDNSEISQKQNSVNKAGGYSSPSFGSNVQSATNGLYRSQTKKFPRNPSSSTGINVNNRNDLVSQSNSPSYRSIGPIDNSKISQKQNSVNNAGGYSTPSFGSNVQSAANGLYRSRTNYSPVNPSTSTGINVNNRNDLVSQSNSPSYRSIRPIDNSEISQKQNSVNNAGGYSSPSFGSNVQSAANGLYRSRTNYSPVNPSTSTGINVNNRNDLVSQSNSPSYRSIGPIDNNEISQKQNSVNNAGEYSSASFGSNVQSATNGLYRSQPNNYPENPISSTGLNLNNKNSLVSQSNSPSYRSIGPIDNSEISQKQNSVNNAGGYSSASFGSNVQSATNGLYRSQTNNYPENPSSSTGINVNNRNDLVSQSNLPSYRSIRPIDNSEISQKQNSVNNAGGYSSPSFGSNVQSATNGLYRSQPNNFAGNPSSSTGINVNNRNDLISQSNSPSYRSYGPVANLEVSQNQNSLNNAGDYSSPSFGSNVQSATNG
nr:probable serine/threonine-protein kinase clkA isoform X2 [Lepeophtheirus salmonis]